ncbi:Zinc finger, RING-type [Sesbania bispinosa]|nr:Zinc finger, RING-type [Sesbania bispinosa]
MASEPDVSEISSLFERPVRNRDMSLFLPLIFGFSDASPRTDREEDPDQETERNEDSQHQRIILVNPFTQGMVVIDGASSLEALFRELGNTKGGRPPASKESIDAMLSVEIGESEDGECVVCLEEFEVGGVVKEMPCKHRFHQNCIEKWLGIHGSCPVCRRSQDQNQAPPADDSSDSSSSPSGDAAEVEN